MTETALDKAIANTLASDAKRIKAENTERMATDLQTEAQARSIFLDAATARDIAKANIGKFDEGGNHIKKGISWNEWYGRRLDKNIKAMTGGTEAEAMDPKLVTSWLRDGNKTAFSQLAKQHPILKLHSVAQQHGKRDAFDFTSPHRPTTVRKAGEPERPAPRGANPFAAGASWNLTAQGRLWRDDPTKAKQLMQEANAVRLGQTQKELRGGR